MPDIAFGEVAPSVVHIIPAGWRMVGTDVITASGQTYPIFPTLPAQVFRYPEGWSFKGISAPTGREAFLFTDNSVRDNEGKLLGDLAALGESPLSIGGGKTSKDVLRSGGYGVGDPIKMGAENVAVSSGATKQFVESAAVLGYSAYDPNNAGLRLYPVRPEPAYNGDLQAIPASWPWLWSDGKIRLYSGGVVNDAPVSSVAPYFPPPTTDGTRGGSGGSPVLVSAVAPVTDPFESDDLIIGRGPGSTGITPPYVIPTTAGSGSGSSGGNAAPQPTTTLPTGAVTTTTAPPAAGSFNLSAIVLGLPLWAWLAAGAVIITKRKG